MRKELFEKRNSLVSQMQAIIDKAKKENRALTEEENNTFNSLEEEIAALDATSDKEDKMRNYIPLSNQAFEEKTTEQKERDAFENFLRTGKVENAETPFKAGENGAIIPSSIAQKIIDKVVDICPIFSMADRYKVGGTLSIPYYDDSTGDITMSYCEEFTDGESTSGKFKSIQLTGFLARAICDVSKKLINESSFDVVNFVINKMAQNIAKFIDKELLVGTKNKIAGLTGVTQEVVTAANNKITADELIDLQDTVPDAYQADAVFIMNRKTRSAIRKLKDNDNNYLLNRDISTKWGYTLLGKPVYTSDNMPEIAAGACAIYYGDMKGLAVKISEDINIDVLTEIKARQHAIEVIGFVDLDAKVQNAEMIAKLSLKSGS